MLARPLGVEFIRVVKQRTCAAVIPPLAENHRQNPKRLRMVRLLLADLEKYPLRGFQVALYKESPT